MGWPGLAKVVLVGQGRPPESLGMTGGASPAKTCQDPGRELQLWNEQVGIRSG